MLFAGNKYLLLKRITVCTVEAESNSTDCIREGFLLGWSTWSGTREYFPALAGLVGPEQEYLPTG